MCSVCNGAILDDLEARFKVTPGHNDLLAGKNTVFEIVALAT